MPAGPSVAWPTTITASGPTFPVPQYRTARYSFAYAQKSLITSQRYTYVFAENTESGELPFRNLQRGWTVDDLITKATVAGVPYSGPATEITVTNTDAESLYGERAVQFTDIVLPASPTTETQAQAVAERYANARSESKFVVQSLQVTSKMCESHVGGSSASEQMWAELLDSFSGMWQVATVEFTPAGTSTSLTVLLMIWERLCDATPEDGCVTLSCYPADTGGFSLRICWVCWVARWKPMTRRRSLMTAVCCGMKVDRSRGCD